MNYYKNFCLECGWNDSFYGCTSHLGEEVYQCPLYMHYHPDEVEQFNVEMEEWCKQKESEVF